MPTVDAEVLPNVDAEVLGAGVELNVGVVLLVGSDVAVQSFRTRVPGPEYVLVGQFSHVNSDVAAVAVLYFPGEHSIQAADPLTSLKLPAAHASHSPPSGPLKPLLQMQLVINALPFDECVCAGQSLHTDSEVSPLRPARLGFEYLPAAHASHAPNLPPWPELHVHDVLARGE